MSEVNHPITFVCNNTFRLLCLIWLKPSCYFKREYQKSYMFISEFSVTLRRFAPRNTTQPGKYVNRHDFWVLTLSLPSGFKFCIVLPHVMLDINGGFSAPVIHTYLSLRLYVMHRWTDRPLSLLWLSTTRHIRGMSKMRHGRGRMGHQRQPPVKWAKANAPLGNICSVFFLNEILPEECGNGSVYLILRQQE